MRKFSFFLLLATAAAPAVAGPRHDGDRGDRHHRSESSERSGNRAERAERRSDASVQRAAEVQRSERVQSDDQGMFARVREQARERRELRQQSASAQSHDNNQTRSFRRGERRGEDAQAQSSWRPRERVVRTIPDTTPNVSTSDRRGELARSFDGRPRRDYRNGNYTRWSSNHWRNDHRYDWRRHRDRHRSIFRLGFYYDPFDWGYRRWSIGSFLFPSYYSSRYWLNDPWQYRLPPAYGPYRWVRYWDDALLVNIYTGEVVDVIHNFFW